MPPNHDNSYPLSFLVLGAGVIGLSTALTLRETYPTAHITIVAKHFPGDRSIEYTSPWAGANWCSMATDDGPLEGYDRVTFERFGRMVEEGVGEVVGLGRMGLRAVFDAGLEEVGVLSQGTGKIWYEELVGGMRYLEKKELPEGAVFGLDFKSTFRINTQVYLNWFEALPFSVFHSTNMVVRLQQQVIEKGIKTVRRHYPSIKALLNDFPSTTALLNCSALGSLHLEDVKDTNMYPSRGQTILVAEPKKPIERMYLRTPKRVDPTVAYVVRYPQITNHSLSIPFPEISTNKTFSHTVPPPQRRRRHPRRQQTRQRLVPGARHGARQNNHAALLRPVSRARKA